LPFQLVTYELTASSGSVAHSTLGLSEQVLLQPRGRAIRQELVVNVSGDVNAYSWLAVLGEHALTTRQSWSRGAVSEVGQPVAPGSILTAFYFTAPAFWDDDLALYLGLSDPTFVVLALPVSTNERAFVLSHGWTQFENLLAAASQDLTDPLRGEVDGVHCSPASRHERAPCG